MHENLKIEMRRYGISIQEIADALRLHRDSVSNKIDGKTDFTLDQAIAIKNTFFSNLDFFYLFKKFPIHCAS